MMPFAWRVGFWGWKTAARCAVPLAVHADVLWDGEAGVFVASSDDFLPQWGCVAEAPTWDGLEKELRTVISEALEEVPGRRGRMPVFTPVLHFAHPGRLRRHGRNESCLARLFLFVLQRSVRNA